MQPKIQHDLIAELKQIASELGRVPTKWEFIERTKIGEYAYKKAFGSFVPFLQAAGLRREESKKHSIFAHDIEQVIKPDRDKTALAPRHGISKKILVLGDTHFPFVCPNALSGVYAWLDKNKDVTHVVQVGDLFDCFSFGRFPRSLLDFTPKQEIDLGRRMAVEMWETIKKIAPKAKCHQLLGNHCIRPMKKALEQAPELEVFLDYQKFWHFEGVITHHDVRQPLVIEDIYFMHGYLLKLGDHAKKHGVNFVCGHTHRGGVVAMQLTNEKVVYELNAGYLGDPTTKALSYTATKLVEWTKGFGVIDDLGARFISL